MDIVEYSVGEKVYIDLGQLVPLRPYAIGCASIPQLLKKKGFKDIVNGKVVSDILEVTEKRSRKYGSVFVNKEEVNELFEEGTTEVDPPAPPIIEDEDLVFFRDQSGKEHNVLMRGERTKEGIYFRVKDVMNVFQINKLNETIQDHRSGYERNVDYNRFLITSHNDINRNGGYNTYELYLTYGGLLRVIHCSRSGLACQFRDWIDTVVFSLIWGSQEQKVEVVKKALNVSADHLKYVMSKSGISISCLYLIDVGITDDGKRVYKYGFTDNVARRFKEHMRKYGDDIKLDKFIFIPALDLSRAETEFRHSISRYKFNKEGEAELICLCGESLLNVHTIFGTIADKYCGNMRTQIAFYENEMKEMQYRYELQLRDKDIEIGRLQACVQLRDKDIEILTLKLLIANKAA